MAVTGLQPLNFNKLKAAYGEYAQIQNNVQRSNSTEPRTFGRIVLGPTGSQSNTYSFLNFNTRKVVEGFNYNSGENTEWVTIEDMRKLIVEHVDSTFQVDKF